MTTRATITPAMAKTVADTLIGLPVRPLRITWRDGAPDCTVDAKRSLNQNALFHVWLGEIARHNGDVDAHEVKGICHKEYGLPIRLRDNAFAFVWEAALAHFKTRFGRDMTYEEECRFLASGAMKISSGMSTAELKEYLDTMQRAFAQQGVFLTQPEDRG